jgi:hypothetical protein
MMARPEQRNQNGETIPPPPNSRFPHNRYDSVAILSLTFHSLSAL